MKLVVSCRKGRKEVGSEVGLLLALLSVLVHLSPGIDHLSSHFHFDWKEWLLLLSEGTYF